MKRVVFALTLVALNWPLLAVSAGEVPQLCDFISKHGAPVIGTSSKWLRDALGEATGGVYRGESAWGVSASEFDRFDIVAPSAIGIGFRSYKGRIFGIELEYAGGAKAFNKLRNRLNHCFEAHVTFHGECWSDRKHTEYFLSSSPTPVTDVSVGLMVDQPRFLPITAGRDGRPCHF